MCQQDRFVHFVISSQLNGSLWVFEFDRSFYLVIAKLSRKLYADFSVITEPASNSCFGQPVTNRRLTIGFLNGTLT